MGKIIEIGENDSVMIISQDSKQEIRLYGIACPVREQPFHEKARVLMRRLTLGKTAEITQVSKDGDGVIRGLVRVEGSREYLNLQLISYGLAWVKDTECRIRSCDEWRQREKLAREKAIGLWSESPNIPPWEWKRAERLEIFRKGLESLDKPR